MQTCISSEANGSAGSSKGQYILQDRCSRLSRKCLIPLFARCSGSQAFSTTVSWSSSVLAPPELQFSQPILCGSSNRDLYTSSDQMDTAVDQHLLSRKENGYADPHHLSYTPAYLVGSHSTASKSPRMAFTHQRQTQNHHRAYAARNRSDLDTAICVLQNGSIGKDLLKLMVTRTTTQPLPLECSIRQGSEAMVILLWSAVRPTMTAGL